MIQVTARLNYYATTNLGLKSKYLYLNNSLTTTSRRTRRYDDRSIPDLTFTLSMIAKAFKMFIVRLAIKIKGKKILLLKNAFAKIAS